MPAFKRPARARRPPDSAQVTVPDHVDSTGIGGGDHRRLGACRQRLHGIVIIEFGLGGAQLLGHADGAAQLGADIHGRL